MPQPSDNSTPIDLAADYALGDLSARESLRLRQALEQDPALFAEIQSSQEALSLLPYCLPTVEPSARLKDKILSVATRSTENSELKSSSSSRGTEASVRSRQIRGLGHRWLPAISTGIAVAAIAALGINQIQWGQPPSQTLALQQQLESTNAEIESLRQELRTNQDITALLGDPNTQVHSLVGEASEQMDTRGATARILVKPGDSKVTLVAQGLPPLPEGKIYRFWAVTQAGAEPTYCGEFSQGAGGTAQWAATNTACVENPLQTMVTLDAPSDPTTAPGPTVLQSIS
ncbi:MAG: hypothetical protein DCF25_22390 [Leptolyngbya foveolarum]|uniref:Anti-sigma K factor RskA C-terminal domain-containing protein n=1 Tax=Leptolyngbya foveolarum TaxID=47253 RepID=A0A2W4TGC6_9CYAN|nr:MAG: hypothetical protein DCF25_22390 [Leptolyngbya foveolarum]